jgi:hypothetical protein
MDSNQGVINDEQFHHGMMEWVIIKLLLLWLSPMISQPTNKRRASSTMSGGHHMDHFEER